MYENSLKYKDYNIILIVAASENNVIGNGGKIPWRISEDLKRFNDVTRGHKVVMGRKTYYSLPEKYRPLPERENIILSRSEDLKKNANIQVFSSIDDVLKYVEDEKTFIIGGESVYKDFMDYAKMLDITRVHRSVEGDTFFPEVDYNLWKLVCQESLTEYGKDYLENFSHLIYLRK